MNEPSTSRELQSTSRDYRSYILRLWSSDPAGTAGWQASLEDSETGQRIGFANLEELFFFLIEQSAQSSTPNRRKT